MTFPTPPQGWDMLVGTWGTDADRNESITQSGQYSLHFLSTAVATSITSPLISIEQGLDIIAGMLVRADSNAGANTIIIGIEKYDIDRQFVSYEDVTGEAVAVADTWEWKGERLLIGGTTRYVKIRFTKAANAFNVYFDNALFERVSANWGTHRTSAQSIPTATWTTLAFNGDMYSSDQSGDVTAERCSRSGGVITIGPPGQYSLSAAVTFTSTADGTYFDIRLKIVGTDTRYRYGTALAIGAGENVRLLVSVANEILPAGATVEVQVYHGAGGNLSTDPSTASESVTYFTGARLGKV